MRGIAVMCAAFGLLAGCGSNENEETNIAAAGQGEEVSASAGADRAVNLPDGFAVYPGADVVTSTDITSSDGGGTIVVMTSRDSPQDLLDYYRAQAEAAGVAVEPETPGGETRVIAGEGADGLTFSFNASAGGDVTTAQLAVGRGLN